MARKILLADDSVTAQNMGRKILSDAGYEVITVNNGSAALKKIAEHKPDLIILDVYMPGYSGLEVCQRLKEAQETVRIPVLLSVGKLEPFKAEEAQRVRADSFIVKPFEATELLSALSKLEDKIVPQPEPSKPGRFSRAIAAAEESSRRGETKADSGWKERISLPKKKTAEAERETQEEEAIYKPVTRDLVIAVEKSTPETESKPQEAAEAKVSGSLPGDVTPEELAAIAAAMARMQDPSAQAEAAQLPRPEAQSTGVPAQPVAAEQVAAEPEKTESIAAEAVASSHGTAAGGAPIPAGEASQNAEALEEVPATMAATAETIAAANEPEPRWVAVPAVLGTDESAISLEQEMLKAYAAFSAAEANHPGFVDSAPPVQVAENFVSEEVVAEPPVPVSSNQEPERAVSATAMESSPAVIAEAQPEAYAVVEPAVATEAPNPFPVQAEAATMPESAPEAAPIEARPGMAFDEVVAAYELVQKIEPQFAQQEETSPANIAIPVAAVAVAEPGSPEQLPVPEPEPQVAMAAAASSSGYAPVAEKAPQQEESDRVAGSAAAWANWHQIRDAGEAKAKAAETSSSAFVNTPASAQAEPVVEAVAAGAENIVQEASATPSSVTSSSSDPTAIASIVESVLADLRPRLIEEISRKMAEKK
ncbi:MAG: response regulator [Candidatus Sulfotelmatobacter sp.]